MILEWNEQIGREVDDVLEKCGVYIISTCQKSDGMYAVNYVGQSENLHDRLAAHFSESEQNELLKKQLCCSYRIKLSWAYVDKKYLNGVELYLYRALEPSCNKIIPPGNNVIECNLPNVRRCFPVKLDF